MATAYQIKQGDTLSQLAQTNNTTVADLMKSNPSITDPNKIYAGASLNLPTVSTTTPTTTPVVNAQPAINQVNDIKNILDQNHTNLAQQQAQKDADALALKNKPPVPPPTPPAPKPADQKIADHGMVDIWDTQTGQTKQVAEAEPIPKGWTKTDLQTGASVAEVQSGTAIYKKFADGNIGRYDVATGKYTGPGTEQSYKDAQTAASNSQKLQDLIDNKLPPEQQAQIESMKKVLEARVKQQEIDNANLVGGTTIAQNLYGLGGTSVATSEITRVVDAGKAKVDELLAKNSQIISQMTQAFKNDDMAALKDAYNQYTAIQTHITKTVSDMHNEVVTANKEETNRKAAEKAALTNDINALQLDVSKAGGAEKPEAYAKALANNDYAGMIEAAGNTATTGMAGEYNFYKRGEIAAGTPLSQIMTPNQYMTADANRKARVAAAGVANGYSQQTMTKVVNIAGDFKNEPTIKEYQVMKEAKDTINNIPDDTQNPADQQNIIYAFAKTMDPNSVVREGEYATVQKYAQSMSDTFGFSVKRMASNSPFLTNQAMKNMKETINNRVAVTEKSYNNIYGQYTNKINKITGGTDASDYITDYSKGYTSIGDEHIQKVADKKVGLKTFADSNTKNTALINSMRSTFPSATPEQIYDKLKEKGLIQ